MFVVWRLAGPKLDPTVCSNLSVSSPVTFGITLTSSKHVTGVQATQPDRITLWKGNKA